MINLTRNELKDFLEEKVKQYNRPSFIETDPVSIPHRYSVKEDIEIAGFLAATIAWGNRKMILRNAGRMMELMDDAPGDFVMNHWESDLERLRGFVHRTFNSADFEFFIRSLRNIYVNHSGLEGIFTRYKTDQSLQPAIHMLSCIFFELPHQNRTLRHVSDTFRGSAAKKINMYLRWMVRNDNRGVDFGIWKSISPSILSCPLDVHSGNVARKLGLIKRKQNDARAVAEIDSILREFDPSDPVKYDFALFGLGVFEGF